MKYRVLGTTLLFLLAASVYGQSRYDIPFAFHIGDRNMAAGRYNVSSEGPMSVLTITSASGPAFMVLPQGGIEAQSTPALGKLVFHCYGNSCFLSEVWRAGSNLGERLGKSRAEREIAKAAASNEATAVYASVR